MCSGFGNNHTGPNDLTNVAQANAADQVGGINISLSIGTSSASSSSQQNSNTAASSTLIAGGDINITATGDGSSNPNKGNINVMGSTLKAADDITLTAQNAINLQAAQNTQTLTSESDNSAASIGVSLNLGAAGGVA